MHKCLYFLDVPYDDVTISAMDIPLAKPYITETEHKYVTDALRKNQISGSGEYIEKCEGLLAKYTSREHAVLVANGTVALHLALLTLNIGPGDEVIVPAFGYVAFANAVKYVGAKPILVDIENETLGLDPIILEAKITSRTKAILVVHNYGLLGKIDIILDIANKYDIPIIEDAAEALGGKLNNQKAGSFGIISTYSFYGNKIATSGEGGAVLTDDATLAKRIQMLRGQGMDPEIRYYFPILGYNYRISNLLAAFLFSQLQNLDFLLAKRKAIFESYMRLIPNHIFKHATTQENCELAPWLFTILLESESERNYIKENLAQRGIETRPTFIPLPNLPEYFDIKGASNFPVSYRVGSRGLSLPTYVELQESQIEYIATTITKLIIR